MIVLGIRCNRLNSLVCRIRPFKLLKVIALDSTHVHNVALVVFVACVLQSVIVQRIRRHLNLFRC